MTWFRVGGAGIPASLKNAMNAVFNKKFGTTGQNYPPKQWPDDVNLLGPLPEGTASGPIANFTDGADDVPIKNWIVNFPGSLDGYSEANGTRNGKNFLDDTLANLEQGSINGSTGNNENANNRVRSIHAIPFPYDKIASSYAWTIPNGYKVAIRPFDKNGNFVQLPSWALAFITQLPTDLIGQGITQMKFVLAKTDNSAITPSEMANVGFQIEVGAATAYEAYKTPSQHTASLDRIINGGTADVVKGTGTEMYGKVVFDGTEGSGGTPAWTMISVTQGTMFRITVSGKVTTSATNTVCSYYTPTAQAQRADGTVSGSGTNVDIIDNRFSSVDAFKEWLAENPVTLVYELATSTDFNFTPITPIPETALGTNNFWADEGDTTVVYRRDIDLALQAVSSSRGLMMASRPVTQLVGEESDPDQVNELVEDDENDIREQLNEVVENDETEQEGEDDAR